GCSGDASGAGRQGSTPSFLPSFSAVVNTFEYVSRGRPGKAIGVTRWTVTVCESVYFSRPSAPWRRPTPESLKPPIGASTEAKVAAKPSLTLTEPAWIFGASTFARDGEVHSEAFRP